MFSGPVTALGLDSAVLRLGERVEHLFRPAMPDVACHSPGRVGLEIELIPVRDGNGAGDAVRADELWRAFSDDPALVRDARITLEPGGQVELSPPPVTNVASLFEQCSGLMRRLRACASAHDLRLLGVGAHPTHDAESVGLQVDGPRYRAVQGHFDKLGHAGRALMRLTAALHLNLDLPPAPMIRPSWQLLNHAGPALAAAFANSPVLAGGVTGRRSSRLGLWLEVDPGRTGLDFRHVGTGLEAPTRAYHRWVLDAEVIPMPREDHAVLPQHLPLRAWLGRGGSRPDVDDLDHHLTTLYPPVRPRGRFEVRYLDALPERWMPVPVCVLTALAYDPQACSDALSVLETGRPLVRGGRDMWRRAAERGLSDPALRNQALELFDLALEAMARLPRGYLPSWSRALVEEYRERFVLEGRSPSDEWSLTLGESESRWS
jgi:glutamate--cysteine ligase